MFIQIFDRKIAQSIICSMCYLSPICWYYRLYNIHNIPNESSLTTALTEIN